MSIDAKKDDQSAYFEFDNLPNRITLFRILIIPIVVASLGLQVFSVAWMAPYQHLLGWIAGWSFTVASITDFVDGYVARKKNIVTVFGSFLDPIADKFLVISALIMLQALDRMHFLIVLILILREVYMTSLRLLATNEGISLPVNSLGKWKTATQMTGIPMLMANAPLWGIPLQLIGPICIYIASFLSLYSAFVYSAKLLTQLKKVKSRV